MTPIDIGIAVFALAMAAIGWERGLAASFLPLAGFVVGVAIAARLGPALLDGGAESPYAPAVAAFGGVLLGLFFAIVLAGAGRGLSERLAGSPGTRVADSVGGAALLAILALATAWVFGAVALYAPGARDLRETVQRSAILGALNDVAPPSGPLLNALRRIDPAQAVRGPDADVAAPNESIVRDPEVRAASQSVVKITGSACGLGVEGSGWVAGPEIVVTNAHVVAGQSDTEVETTGGEVLAADAVAYQPRNDLAILSVPGLNDAALGLAGNVRRGTSGATVGYPENGPLTLTAARLGSTGTVQSQDSYGRGPVERQMTPFRGLVRSGNSGGPVIDGRGQVVTTVFAASLGDGPGDGLGVPNEIVKDALNGRLDGASTGPCAA